MKTFFWGSTKFLFLFIFLSILYRVNQLYNCIIFDSDLKISKFDWYSFLSVFKIIIITFFYIVFKESVWFGLFFRELFWYTLVFCLLLHISFYFIFVHQNLIFLTDGWLIWNSVRLTLLLCLRTNDLHFGT